jgi:hypothetical protein
MVLATEHDDDILDEPAMSSDPLMEKPDDQLDVNE